MSMPHDIPPRRVRDGQPDSVVTTAFAGKTGMKRQRIQSLLQGTQLFGQPAKRGISLLVLTAYLAAVAGPAVAGVRQEVFGRPKPLTESSVFKGELTAMREQMRQFNLTQRLTPADNGALAKLKGLFTDSPRVQAERQLADTLLSAKARLQSEATEQDQAMAATRARLLEKHLPASILARHDAAVKTIAARRSELLSTLTQLQTAHTADKSDQRSQLLNTLDKQLEQWGGEKAAKTDYKHLPWGSPDSKVRAPRDSKLAYSLNLEMFGIKPLQVAGPIPAGTILPVLPQLPSTPQAGDLTETEDIKLTDAIRAKATELHKNPSEIYRWVHDNVEYIPTYGSIQGADYVLQTKRGNAFDTASLLIGLLRVSNIPARYVYGTIEVPINQAMNWVGGVTNPDAVLNLMGQGGIPNIGLTQGGKIVAVRMEHVWVEAYIDYVPSRGVVNKSPDTWVPLDASFKQYSYTAPLDIKAAVPFDAQALVTDIQTGATVNDSQGYVQNIDQSKIQTALTNYQAQVKSYLEQQQPNATVGDILGTKTIKPYASKLLSQELPAKLVTVAGDFQTLPDTMRHYFNYRVYTDVLGRDTDSPTIQKKLSLPYLAGKSLALSFRPATADDEATINSYLPQPHADGTPIDPSELPSSLPGYLINVKPELTVDGQVIASGDTQMLGSDAFTKADITSPGSGLSRVESENRITAGEYHVVGIDTQGVSSDHLNRIKADLVKAKQRLDGQQYMFLSKHDLTGSILGAGLYGYFVANDVQDQSDAKALRAVVYRQPSYGSFSSTLSTQSAWGVPRSVGAAGFTIDMDRMISSVIDVAGNKDMERLYRKIAGNRMSANEHLVPEQLLSTPDRRVEGVSAVKALQVAAQEGQRVYTITRENIDQVLSGMVLSQSVKDEIVNAVGAGYQVMTSQGAISYAGWTGVGYIVSDEKSGAAAFKISGGHNGGSIKADVDRYLATVGIAVAPMVTVAVQVVDTSIGIMSQAASMVISFVECNRDAIVSFVAIAIAIALLALLMGPAIAAGAKWIGEAAVLLFAIFGMQSAVAADFMVDPNNVKCTCPPGRLNSFGTQCWVCGIADKLPARQRVADAKESQYLRSCNVSSSLPHQELVMRQFAWEELGDARDAENMCYEPPQNYPGPTHRAEAAQAHTNAAVCLDAQLGR